MNCIAAFDKDQINNRFVSKKRGQGENASSWVIFIGRPEDRLLLFPERFNASQCARVGFPHRMVFTGGTRTIHHGGGDPMSTLQIENPSHDISATEEPFRVRSEVSTPPHTTRPVPTCRFNTPTFAAESETAALINRSPLATAFLEDLRDSIIALDAHGHCLFVNRAFETLTGFCRSELLGTLLCNKVEETQRTNWSSLARVFGMPSDVSDLPQLVPLHSQFRMHRADGSLFDVAVRWDRFPGSASIAASFLLCKEMMTVESELQSRIMEFRVLRDELNALLDVRTGAENTAYSRWQAHTNEHHEAVGQGAIRAELSRREQEVLHFVLDGKRVGTIAATLFLSENTVRNHLKRIYRKLGVGSLGELREHCSGV